MSPDPKNTGSKKLTGAKILKGPMNPEPVQASLMDHNQTVPPPCPRLALCLQLGKPRKKARDGATGALDGREPIRTLPQVSLSHPDT